MGVSINLFVRRNVPKEQRTCKIKYAGSEANWTRWQKCKWLDEIECIAGTQWSSLAPDGANRWLSDGSKGDFEQLLSVESVFAQQSRGIATSRDAWAYNFDQATLRKNIKKTIAFYNDEVSRWKGESATNLELDIDKFVRYDDSSVGWSRDLKHDVQRERRAEFSNAKVRNSLYRPFTQLSMFFDRILNEEVYVFPSFVPDEKSEKENRLICLTGPGSEKPFLALASHTLADLHLSGAGCSTQCFPFYTYSEDGTHRRENITDWALEQFRSHYHDPSITKWDIFHYIYAVLHHPEYREPYAANLRRELPRIPFVSGLEENASRGAPEGAPFQNDVDVFRQLVKAGQRLAEIHVHYEEQPEYALTRKEKAGEKLDWRVTKMRLSKDKATLVYNDFLTLSGIPKETYDYRLGNRSALEWVIDQYQVSTDKRSGIANDPNRADDPQYIVRLIGQVISVSLETVQIVAALPKLVTS